MTKELLHSVVIYALLEPALFLFFFKLSLIRFYGVSCYVIKCFLLRKSKKRNLFVSFLVSLKLYSL